MKLNKINSTNDFILSEIYDIHNEINVEVSKRIKNFKNIWQNGSNKDLFIELAFCLLTPQAKALEAWKAITTLIESDELFVGAAEEISHKLNRVRFKNNKARHLVTARNMFYIPKGLEIREVLLSVPSIFDRRKWLAENVMGMGYKEASHFLRNIGFVEDLAILDRHILKNMKIYGLIPELPKSINPKTYHELENKLKEFSIMTEIPMGHLDFIFWYKETNTVFK